MINERELLPRLWDLDEQALELVYDAFQPPLYRYVYRMLGHPEAAQDIVGETFRRLLQALHQGRGPKRHIQAWLYRVAHNLVVDQYRRRPAQPPLSLEAVTLEQGDDLDEKVQRQLDQERIRQAIHQLRPAQRQVIALKFLEGMSNKEVAIVLGKSVGAVKSLQHRALAALRRVLSAQQEKAL